MLALKEPDLYGNSELGFCHTSLSTSAFFNYAIIDVADKRCIINENYISKYLSILSLTGTNLAINQQDSTTKLNWDVAGERNEICYGLECSINRSTSIGNQVSVRLNDKNIPSIAVMPALITDMADLRIRIATLGQAVINVVNNNGRLVMKKEFSLSAGSAIFTKGGWAPLVNGISYIQMNNTDMKTAIKVIVQH